MLEKGHKKHHASKKHQSKDKKQVGLTLSPHYKPFPQHPQSRLFESGKLHLHAKKESGLSQRQKGQFSNKVVTTDQSNHGCDSKIHESIFIADPRAPNQEYFNEPLSFKPKKRKTALNNKGPRQSKLQNLSNKIGKMAILVHSQEKELTNMKSSMNEKELHRLIKIHSIEKLKLVEELTALGASSMKFSKKV